MAKERLAPEVLSPIEDTISKRGKDTGSQPRGHEKGRDQDAAHKSITTIHDKSHGSPTGTGPTQVGGFTAGPTTTFTRSNNTTAYSSGQVVSGGAAMQFTIGRPQPGENSGLAVSAWLVDNSNPGTVGSFELWLFKAAVASSVADATTWAPSAADMANFVGLISFGSTAFAGGTACQVYQVGPISQPLLAASGQVMYGVLVARNAYTPAALGVFVAGFGALND